MKMFAFLLCLLGLGSQTKAFEDRQVRYLSPNELFETNKRLFPILSERVDAANKAGNSSLDSCFQITPQNRTQIGAVDPISGDLFVKKPNASFLKWYVNCVRMILDEVLLANQDLENVAELEDLFGRESVVELKKMGPMVFSIPLSAVGENLRMKILTHMTLKVLGPDELIQSYKKIKDVNQFRAKTDRISKAAGPFFRDYFRSTYIQLLLRDEFLSY